MAILEPTLETSQIAQREGSASPYEAAKRVIPKLRREARSKLRWPVEILDYKETVSEQHALRGSAAELSKPLRFAQYRDLASRLRVRYLVSYVVREFTGARADDAFGIGRTTGRTSLALTVYDSDQNKFVWQDHVIDTSTAPGSDLPMGARMDQSMFNALRKALEPFVLKGQTKDVATPTLSYVAVVRQPINGGKKVLLDLGASSDIAVGDILVGLEGNVRLKVVEVLQNGSIAEVLEGEVTKEQVFKSQG